MLRSMASMSLLCGGTADATADNAGTAAPDAKVYCRFVGAGDQGKQVLHRPLGRLGSCLATAGVTGRGGGQADVGAFQKPPLAQLAQQLLALLEGLHVLLRLLLSDSVVQGEKGKGAREEDSRGGWRVAVSVDAATRTSTSL